MANTANHKLLLVDDDPVFCKVLARSLERRGFEVDVAYDVPSALRQAEKGRPPFMVVDLRIGDESGLTVVEKVRAVREDVSIVVLTGFASIATAVEAIKLGATHYLTKPADADEIVAALHRDRGDAEVPVASNPPSVRKLEWEHLQKVLMEHDGNISATARALNMHRRTLQRKLQKRPVKQ